MPLFSLFLSGTCPSAIQGAVGKARWAAEESGRVTARGDQSFGLLFLWTGGLPHALHHSSADICLTKKDPQWRAHKLNHIREKVPYSSNQQHLACKQQRTLEQKCHFEWDTYSHTTTKSPISIISCICISHRAHRVCLQQKRVCLRLLYYSHIVLHC